MEKTKSTNNQKDFSENRRCVERDDKRARIRTALFFLFNRLLEGKSEKRKGKNKVVRFLSAAYFFLFLFLVSILLSY